VPSSDLISLIIVRGNLMVTGNIHSGDDGSVSLTVIGNLCARNLSIGGQEIYVHGDIHVDEVFYGSYNHGETIALGSISALVYIHDDEYRVKAAKGTQFTYRILHNSGFGFWNGIPLLASEILRPELLDEESDEDPAVHIQTHDLTINGSILQDPDKLRKGLPAPQIAPIVSSPAISPASFAILVQSVLMPSSGERFFQFKEGEVTYRVSAERVDEEGEHAPNSVLIQDAQAQYFFYFTEENRYVCLYKRYGETTGTEAWVPLTDMQSAEARQLFAHWVKLLGSVTVAQHYLPRMPKAELESFFHQCHALGLEDEWWFGDLHFKLRHPYTTAEGKPIAPMLRIQTPGESLSFYKYYVLSSQWIECDMQENKGADSITISFSDVRSWEIAMRYYEIFRFSLRLKLASEAD
jgi:hypothetical protein